MQNSWEQLYEQTNEFRQAMKLAPRRVKKVFKEIFMRDRDEREVRRSMRHNTRNRNERER